MKGVLGILGMIQQRAVKREGHEDGGPALPARGPWPGIRPQNPHNSRPLVTGRCPAPGCYFLWVGVGDEYCDLHAADAAAVP
jgi:hypothetical protein